MIPLSLFLKQFWVVVFHFVGHCHRYSDVRETDCSLAMSRKAWLFLMKFRPFLRKEILDNTTNVSVIVYDTMLKCMTALVIDCSNWALEHAILNSGFGYSLMTGYRN